MILKIARNFSKKIHKELLTNPEFDKIYPELLKYKPPTTITKDDKEIPFIKSLLKYRENQEDHLTYEDAANLNVNLFI